jgi:hypothetical protein
MMEAVRNSETSVDNHFTRQYNPEDNSEHHTRRRENLKSHNNKQVYEQEVFDLPIFTLGPLFNDRSYLQNLGLLMDVLVLDFDEVPSRRQIPSFQRNLLSPSSGLQSSLDAHLCCYHLIAAGKTDKIACNTS